jgi:hypothetical protein
VREDGATALNSDSILMKDKQRISTLVIAGSALPTFENLVEIATE